MYDRPDAVELLAIARETFLKELMPELPDSKRYPALMLANALAIASREVQAGQGPLKDELARLSAFYGEAVPEPADEAQLQETLLTLNRRLAADLREGQVGTELLPEIRAHLMTVARQKLLVSNPKYLKAQEA